MKFFEDDIEKYRRRVQKIEQNPDPTKAASNKLLYKAYLEERVIDLEHWKQGKPFAYFSGCREELLEALGFRVIHLDMIADRLAGKARRYFDLCRSAGFPERSVCDRLQVSLGLTLSGDLPPAAIVVGDNANCDLIVQTFVAIGRLTEAPSYFIDKLVEPDYCSLDYITRQLEELIALAEDKVPGVHYDETKLKAIQERERQAQDYLRRVYEAAKSVPTPISGLDAFRIPELGLATTEVGLEYFKAYCEEVEERARQGRGALPEEKLRVLWTVTGPFYIDAFAPLERRGVAVPLVLMDVQRNSCGLDDGLLDWERGGRALSPLEQEAELLTTLAWEAPAERWVQDILKAARDFSADAVVYFHQTGCPTTLTCSGIVVERVKRELGLPVLVLEGWMLESEKFNAKAYEETLNSFVDLCFAQKGIK